MTGMTSSRKLNFFLWENRGTKIFQGLQWPLPLHLSPVSTLLNVASGEVGDLKTENIQDIRLAEWHHTWMTSHMQSHTAFLQNVWITTIHVFV